MWTLYFINNDPFLMSNKFEVSCRFNAWNFLGKIWIPFNSWKSQFLFQESSVCTVIGLSLNSRQSIKRASLIFLFLQCNSKSRNTLFPQSISCFLCLWTCCVIPLFCWLCFMEYWCWYLREGKDCYVSPRRLHDLHRKQ